MSKKKRQRYCRAGCKRKVDHVFCDHCKQMSRELNAILKPTTMKQREQEDFARRVQCRRAVVVM